MLTDRRHPGLQLGRGPSHGVLYNSIVLHNEGPWQQRAREDTLRVEVESSVNGRERKRSTSSNIVHFVKIGAGVLVVGGRKNQKN